MSSLALEFVSVLRRQLQVSNLAQSLSLTYSLSMHYDAVLDLDFALESFFMILVKSSIKGRFCEEMVAAIVKPCIVIVLDIHFKHTL